MVVVSEPEFLGGSTWRISWTGTAPFRVYVDGVLVSTQSDLSFLLTVLPGLSPVVEILDDPDADAVPAFPQVLVMGWRNDADVGQYRIDKWTGAAWETQDYVALDLIVAWQTFVTSVLADETTHQWRVVPIDAAGNVGTEVEFAVLMVRHPDPPTVSYAYDSGDGELTVSAA